jgi:betaine-aldehyde dehydrogenase
MAESAAGGAGRVHGAIGRANRRSRRRACVTRHLRFRKHGNGDAVRHESERRDVEVFRRPLSRAQGRDVHQRTGHLNYTLRQPYGVVAKINAFNHPFRFCVEKAAAPLAAGNSVVIKQPEQAPLSGLRFAELTDGLFPPGVINVITGDSVAGSALVRHPDVHRVAFIGSVETGRIIAREAADGIKNVSLELGGKNPIIIFPDADADKAASLAIKGMNMNRQGQSCSSTSRIFVHEELHDAVVDRLVAEAEKLTVGLPWHEETEVGPLVSEEQLERVMGYIEAGTEEGAELLTGGHRPGRKELDRGFYVEANGIIYGLTAAIVTNDLKLAMETAQRIEAGYLWINSSGRYLGAPYGGWKQSGIGREESLDELLSYTQIKNVNMAW